MLSPSSSSEGDGDSGDFIFPALDFVDLGSPVEYEGRITTGDNMDFKSYSCLNSQNCTAKVGRPPKYKDMEPYDGYAVSGRMSKNAILARENRRKKKEYITSLEQTITQLTQEKCDVKCKLSQAHGTINDLIEEVEYLKSVIANETTIGKLLQNIPNATSLTLNGGNINKTDVNRCAKRVKTDHDYMSVGNNSRKPGVCLHVTDGHVSLEFCKKCSDSNLQSDD